MKILYANPIFLDYRLPLFKRLVELSDGGFSVLYSPARYLGRFDSLLERISVELGPNAIAYDHEKLFWLDTFSFKYKAVAKNRNHRFLPYAIPFTFGLTKFIEKIDPEVLITEGFFQWTPLLCLYARKHKIPIYVSYERTPYTERNTGWLKILERKFIDHYVTGYLVNGSETTKYLYSLGVNESRIHLAGMSADSAGLGQAIFSYSVGEKECMRKQYIQDGGLLYLFSGQMIERKGVRYLLEAWLSHISSNPNDILLLIGGGPLLDTFVDAYASCSSIHFEGKINYNEVYKYYAIADVFILPTLEDNWSLVIPEAMACGLPVATSIYNGCWPELVKEGINGITFDPLQKESILKALDYFHHHDLKVFGANSVEIERPFNTENTAKRVFDVINKETNEY